MGFKFEVFTQQVDESYPSEISAREVALFLAVKKNNNYRTFFTDEIVVTADTTVVINNVVLEKPQDELQAREMITSLIGKEHEVITGVNISNSSKSIRLEDTTTVSFRRMSIKEVDKYIELYKPFDKAGAYGIQEWIGLIGVDRISGSYFNVMGLPTHLVYVTLTEEFDFWPDLE